MVVTKWRSFFCVVVSQEFFFFLAHGPIKNDLFLNNTIWEQAQPLEGRVFANGPEDRGSIPDRVILKTQKMILDAALLNTQHYKVRIKGKVD